MPGVAWLTPWVTGIFTKSFNGTNDHKLVCQKRRGILWCLQKLGIGLQKWSTISSIIILCQLLCLIQWDFTFWEHPPSPPFLALVAWIDILAWLTLFSRSFCLLHFSSTFSQFIEPKVREAHTSSFLCDVLFNHLKQHVPDYSYFWARKAEL